MNMKHIQYVLTVLREGSITGASKKLYVSQPALSQTIKQIEQDLGTPIFDRSTDPISLTYAGQKYVDAAQKMLDIERNLRTQISEMKDEVHGRIRVGISVQRGLQLLPQVIPEFSREYPFIKVELVEHGSDTLERMTSEGHCDLALIATSEKPNKLNYVLIENEQVVLMAARSTQLARRIPDGTPIEITEAQNEKFVSMKSGHSVRLVQDRLFAHHHIMPQILMETSNMEAGKHVAARSNAVMLIPQVYVSNSLDLQYRVQCHPILNTDYERHFYLCYRKGLYLPKYMEDFARIVFEKLEVPFDISMLE
ncbi:MAG: LysR family transcriptional regulator [Clostridia bacterium]|nr:LysR family transcriptional regulator [Clostridia bacterium]MBQ2949053.1 LysR family transcriptional regulator [Clostridia bacterium]MBQ4609680.1 LysR family transcriptional regulator [Clostridia bacterium]MBQ6858999.1 LysR family transcriptional regulator [Clostridia bacterium]MBQ7051755.1 LysR family transcriptional regulator [Clostridia bacterium]